MDIKNFLAPLVRGAVISRTRRPWTVRPTDNSEDGSSVIFIPDVDVTDSASIASAVADSVAPMIVESVPQRISISFKGEVFTYLTAPDVAEMERIVTGAGDGVWGREYFGEFSSRDDVVKNRVAVVTGGAQGFGEEIVRGLVAGGAIVFIADLNEDGAKRLSTKLNEENGRTVSFPVAVNVADEDSVSEMIAKIVSLAGGLDICISNAGVVRAAPILEQDLKAFRFVTDINYTAFAIVTKHCALTMAPQNRSAGNWSTDIIQINSKSGLSGSNKNGSYAGSKFGGVGLVQSFALELISYGIKVNAVCPGNFFNGPLWSDPVKGLFVQYLNAGKVPGAKSVADVKAFYEAKVPMGRGCEGADVLRAINYIVEQKYETGQAVPVTGGQVMLH